MNMKISGNSMTLRRYNACLTHIVRVCGSQNHCTTAFLPIPRPEAFVPMNAIKADGSLINCSWSWGSNGVLSSRRRLGTVRTAAVAAPPSGGTDKASENEGAVLTLQDLPVSDASERMLRIRHSVRDFFGSILSLFKIQAMFH
jgi:hypothetical protein